MSDGRPEIASKRLLNQRLTGAPLGDAAEVVRALGAVQAQDYPVARWSLGLRARGLSETAVDEALGAGDIVRTHVLRDTWHLVCRDDLRWMSELTRPRIQARNRTMHRKLGLEPALLARTDAILVDALGEHGALTRTELAAALRERGVEATGPRLAYVLMHAELEVLISSGPMQGKQHTYALVDERVRHSTSRPRDDALAALARRYFGSHGPATKRDLSWWASLTAADAARAIALLGAELERIEDGGRTYWSAGASPEPADSLVRAHLLQGYDEYVIAYSESRDVLDVRRLARVTPPGRSMFTHAIVLDGQVIGHWRRRLTARAVTIETQLARPLDAGEQAALDGAAERYGRFVGLPVDLAGEVRRGRVP